ncbi:hypothetical protein [Paenibacillus gorillae]|uniref:hypothetical protein n=1 Tax=Paenibacillus gorillae TaxID=1243662 RepID=UPI0004B37A73|nr:hypothetical protein [Paenibacillus gorillae]
MKEMETLLKVRAEFAKVKLNEDMPQQKKDERYGAFMTELERFYKIPIFRDEAFEIANPDLMRIYRQISDERLTLFED